MLQGKPVVGIVPASKYFGTTDSRYNDFYRFTDTYCERAMEAGLVPVGVLPVGEFIRTEVLELCDEFILQGGNALRPYHIDVIDHAVKTGKKLLGICCGCQSIQAYFLTKAEAEKRGWNGKLSELCERMLRKESFHYLSRAEGHYPLVNLPYGDKSACKHVVYLTEGSGIARIFGRTEIMGASFHHYCISDPAPGVVVTGRSADGIVEAIEAGDKIIGTQFHPDADDDLPEVFDWLAE